MADLGWRADGIDRAISCGGVESELYRRPGFTGGMAVRRSRIEEGGAGYGIDVDPDPPDLQPEDRRRRG
jgi:hypothetical protein